MWLLLAACGGDGVSDADNGPDPIDTDLPDGTGTPDTDTTTTVTYFDVANIFVQARFGFDITTQQIEVVERINGTFEFPVIEVFLATSAWTQDLADTGNYCSILLILESSTIADWVLADPRLVWGVDWDPLDPPLMSCNGPGYELNPFDWGLDPILTFTNDPNWGVAVGTPTDDILADFEPVLGEDIQYLIGGTMRVPDMLPGDPLDNVFAYAYTVDADLVLVDADGDGLLDPLPADQVHDGTQLLTSAWFNVFTTTAWSVD